MDKWYFFRPFSVKNTTQNEHFWPKMTQKIYRSVLTCPSSVLMRLLAGFGQIAGYWWLVMLMLTYLLTLLYLLVHFKSILKIVPRLKPYSKLTIEHRASVYEYRVYRLTSIEYRLLMVWFSGVAGRRRSSIDNRVSSAGYWWLVMLMLTYLLYLLTLLTYLLTYFTYWYILKVYSKL